VPADYSVLRGEHRTDVCVIGGGFSGVATALMLAERGAKVILLEANRIGWGASGRNGGQMIGGISGEDEIRRQGGVEGARILEDLHYRGHEIIEARVAKYNIDCDLKYGWMSVAARPSHTGRLHKEAKRLVAAGYSKNIEIVEPADMRLYLGTSAYHGGYIDWRSGHLHPLKLCLGEARAAASLGVEIYEGSRVIDLAGGAKPWVLTEEGRVEANTIVLAGEIFDRFKQRRFKGLMLPTSSYIIATEPLGEERAREIDPHDFAVADSNTVLDYFRLSADKRLLFGGRCDYGNRPSGDVIRLMRPRMLNVFPQLADVKIDYGWPGTIAIVVNRVPAIGRLDPNLYFMQGYSGHGVNATHIAAEIVTDAIGGNSRRLDFFDSIRHIRLPLSDYFGNQMLAVGMLYYRLADML
jgi:glycine/D-amino acid oxidase-like deaminating enzyme